jgi:hypothetical protein
MLPSLVIGPRNRAASLSHCLDVVAAAIRPDCAIEIILADNGSGYFVEFHRFTKWLSKPAAGALEDNPAPAPRRKIR